MNVPYVNRREHVIGWRDKLGQFYEPPMTWELNWLMFNHRPDITLNRETQPCPGYFHNRTVRVAFFVNQKLLHTYSSVCIKNKILCILLGRIFRNIGGCIAYQHALWGDFCTPLYENCIKWIIDLISTTTTALYRRQHSLYGFCLPVLFWLLFTLYLLPLLSCWPSSMTMWHFVSSKHLSCGGDVISFLQNQLKCAFYLFKSVVTTHTCICEGYTEKLEPFKYATYFKQINKYTLQ